MDSAVDTAIETDFSADTGADTTTEVETDATAVEGESGAETAPETGKDFRPVENGRLSPAAKAELDALKVKNPPLAKAIQRALFAEDRLRRELPGGFKEVAELRGKLEELGGETGIQELNQEIGGWREFDNNYSAGDPKVLEFLTQTPEAAAAFLKIAPAAFEKFKEAHPDGYNRYMTDVFAADMEEKGIPMQLAQLGWMLKDNPEALQAVQQIQNYVKGIGQMARKPVSAPAIAAPKVDDRAKQLDTREQQLTKTEWKRETESRHASLFQQNWKSLIGDRKLSDTQVATIKELYGLKLQTILKAKPDFTPNMERYFAAKQKDGFLKLHDSTFKDAVPRALRTAIQQLGIGGKPGPKPGEAAKPPASGVKPSGTPAAPGFAFVGTRPSITEIDNRTTTPQMWQEGKAVLRDGRKVYWKR